MMNGAEIIVQRNAARGISLEGAQSTLHSISGETSRRKMIEMAHGYADMRLVITVISRSIALIMNQRPNHLVIICPSIRLPVPYTQMP